MPVGGPRTRCDTDTRTVCELLTGQVSLDAWPFLLAAATIDPFWM
jgi:hypothetical protein